MNATDKQLEKYIRWILGNRLIVIFVAIILVCFFGAGLSKITMNSDYSYFFDPHDPNRISYERLKKVYSNDDLLLIAVKPERGTIYTPENLRGIKVLTQKSWKIPFSTRVDSITNFQHTEAAGDDLTVGDLVKNASSLTVGDLHKIEKIAQNEPSLMGNIVSKDGSVSAISIKVTLPGESPDEVFQVVEYTKKILSEFSREYPGFQFYLTGLTMLDYAFNKASREDMATLTPLMYLMVLVIMMVFLRNIFGVINTFVIMILSVVCGMGAAGWLGIPITPPSSIAPTLIITLAIADSVHLLKAVIAAMRKGATKHEALVGAFTLNFKPIFLTSLTTSIGFLSLNFSDTIPFHDLGNITATGVMFSFLLSTTVLPVLTDLLPFKVSDRSVEAKENGISRWWGEWLLKHHKKVLAMSMLSFVILGLQIQKIKINDQFVNYFSPSNSFRVASDFVMKNLTGIYEINFDLRAGESQGITRPDYLHKIDEFCQFARTVPGIVRVDSITDTFKRLNKNMHGDDPAHYMLPKNRDLAAQYLLLYEMSLPYGLDLNSQIDIDKAGTKVTVIIGNLETRDFIRIKETLEGWLKENTPSYMHTLGTSPAIMFANITHRNVLRMAWGTGLAFLVISGVLIFAFGSLKYGLLSLLPNVIPICIAFGFWAIAIGQAGFAIAVVASVTLGIVVDDTIHFLSRYLREKKQNNCSSHEAILKVLDNVAPTLIATSSILVGGFSMLMFSTFKINWTLGALSALIIAAALLVDLTFLPSMLLYIDKKSNLNLSKQ